MHNHLGDPDAAIELLQKIEEPSAKVKEEIEKARRVRSDQGKQEDNEEKHRTSLNKW